MRISTTSKTLEEHLKQWMIDKKMPYFYSYDVPFRNITECASCQFNGSINNESVTCRNWPSVQGYLAKSLKRREMALASITTSMNLSQMSSTKRIKKKKGDGNTYAKLIGHVFV